MSDVAEVEEYPPYSGEDPTCPKCHHVGASTEYKEYGRCHHHGSHTVVVGLQYNERLHRSCRNCDYSWDEAVQ